jgi:hypothetical protein
VIGRSWTTKRVERVWKQLRSGVSVKLIAAQQGCTVTNIHRRLRTAGYDPQGAAMAENVESNRSGLIYARRREGVEFADIAVELGLEPTPSNVRRLYMRLVRYCERAEVPYPRVPRRHRAVSNRTEAMRADAVITKAKKALHTLAAPGCATTNTALATSLGLPERESKLVVAELRRKRILADGLAPMPFEVSAPLLASETAVLHAIVVAWDQGMPCESLDSLTAKLNYSKSTINVAIIKLRSLNLVYPRGMLVLRKDI